MTSRPDRGIAWMTPLEINGYTGGADEFTHISEGNARKDSPWICYLVLYEHGGRKHARVGEIDAAVGPGGGGA